MAPGIASSPWVMLLLGFFLGGISNLLVSAATEKMNDLGKLRLATSRINRLCTALANQVLKLKELEQRIAGGRSVGGLTVTDSRIADLVAQLEEGLDMLDWEFGSMLVDLFRVRPERIQQLVDQASSLGSADRAQRMAELASYRGSAELAQAVFQEFSQVIRNPNVDLAALDAGVMKLRQDLVGAFAENYPQQFATIEGRDGANKPRLSADGEEGTSTTVDT